MSFMTFVFELRPFLLSRGAFTCMLDFRVPQCGPRSVFRHPARLTLGSNMRVAQFVHFLSMWAIYFNLFIGFCILFALLFIESDWICVKKRAGRLRGKGRVRKIMSKDGLDERKLHNSCEKTG